MLIGRKSIVFIVIFMMIFAPCLGGCSKNKSPSQKPAPGEQRPEPPQEFKKILTAIDSIIVEVGKKIEMQEAATIGQIDKIVSSKDQQDKETGQEGSKNSQQNQGQSGGSKQQTSSSMMINWDKEDQSLKDIHRNWNDLQPEAIKAGLTTNARDDFDAALDRLTAEIGMRNLEGALFAAIGMYKNYADLDQVFKSPVPPMFYRTQYEAMTAIAEGRKENWEQAAEHIPAMKDQWDQLKMQAQDIEPKTITCTEIAINDVIRAIDNRSRELVLIKGEIAISDLGKLKDEFSRKKMGGGQ